MGEAAKKVETEKKLSAPQASETPKGGREEVDALLEEINELKENSDEEVEAPTAEVTPIKREKVSAKMLFQVEEVAAAAAESADEETSAEEAVSVEAQLNEGDLEESSDLEDSGYLDDSSEENYNTYVGDSSHQELSMSIQGQINLNLNYQVNGHEISIRCEEGAFVIQMEGGVEFRVPLPGKEE